MPRPARIWLPGATGASPPAWPVWGAVAWAVGFGLLSLWWAAGGMLGVSTLAHDIQDAARAGDREMLRLAAITGWLKIAAGLLAAWSLRPVGGRRLRRVGLWLLWGCGALFALYGLTGFVQTLLMGLGVLAVSDAIGADVVWWYVLLWEPVWILGGALFLLTAWRLGRALRGK